MLRTVGRITTTVLVLLAVGLVSWFIYARVTGASLIVFRTGSMSPAMPQGAMALTHPHPAADVHVGDVVTVRRPGSALPITHRVTQVSLPSADDGLVSPELRELTLQGDANKTPDARPYVVREVRKVNFAVPEVGNALTVTQSPIGMGLLIVTLGGLVTWAFWPPPTQPNPQHRDE